jgi:GAF domain-containing protein
MSEAAFLTAQDHPIALNESETAAFIKASQAILGKESFPETARTIFDQARSLTGATAGYVALLSENGEENEVLFLEAGGAPCSVDPDLPMPIRGLRAESYQRNITVYDNAFDNSEFTRLMPAGHVALKNVMFAPLVISQKTVGIIGLANKPTDFTARDAEVAAMFGGLAAIALANSRNLEKLQAALANLQKALAEVKQLRGIIPICARCKQIRDEKGLWNQIEEYIAEHTDALFSHGLCPKCLAETRAEALKDLREEKD